MGGGGQQKPVTWALRSHWPYAREATEPLNHVGRGKHDWSACSHCEAAGAEVHTEAAADIQARDGGDLAAWVVDGSKRFLGQTSRAWEWDVGQGIRAFWAS